MVKGKNNQNGTPRMGMSYGMYILAMLIFGTNGYLVAHLSIQSSQIVLLRTLIGGTLLTVLVFLRGGFDREAVRTESKMLILGGAALGMNWVALFEAYRLLNVSLATLIYYAGPMLVLLFSPLLFREKLTTRKIAAVAVVSCGLVCISGSIAFGGMNSVGLLTASASALFYALNDLFGGGLFGKRLDRMELARVGQATEHKYVGTMCGIMDQFISMHGREGSLVRLDCRSGEFEYFPWHPKGYRLVLVNSCVKHELVGSPYNDRRRSCERVAQMAGVETLRDCTWEMLERLKEQVGEEDYRRAKYVLGEYDRVMAVCDALQKDDYETVGQQMYLTHEGLSKDYEVSCEEIDFLVEVARRCGVTGSRIMGGGFGGCTINLVKDECHDGFVEEVQKSYKERFGVECKVIPVVIGEGARRIE